MGNKDNQNNQDKLKELENAERLANPAKFEETITPFGQQPLPVQNTNGDENEETPNKTVIFKKVQNSTISDNNMTATSGFRRIEKLPFNGALYPSTWVFGYSCPITDDVANFSTLDQQDTVGITRAVENLVRKYVTIYDTDLDIQVDTGELNDGERLFFFLKLKEFYLHDAPINYVSTASNGDPVDIKLLADSLSFPVLKPGLLACYDGRKFRIPIKGTDKFVEFLIPNLDRAGKVFNYIINSHKKLNNEDTNKTVKEQVEEFNKKFLVLAPYLFIDGKESIQDLKKRFNEIKADTVVYNAYLAIINKLKLNNNDYIEYQWHGQEERAMLQFPGGWKSMFVADNLFEGDLF